jgi:hypothetical protein
VEAQLIPTEDPLAALAGEWEFRRTVLDRLTGSTGEASGTARFEPSESGLDWLETGSFRLDGHSFDARRHLAIRPEEGGWVVRFGDGRLFHPLELGEGRCRVGHPCREDFYDGVIEMVDDGEGPELRTEWQVRGPAKDQLITTRYRRSG